MNNKRGNNVKTTTKAVREADLYPPVQAYLTRLGYTVRGEVRNWDITAVRDDELIAVELKCSMNLTLLVQATQRQRAADSVYVAVPRPRGGIHTRQWRHICHLLRRLEIGLILVAFREKTSGVEVVFHPEPLAPRKNSGLRRSVLREMEGRTGDWNTGGVNKVKLMTAYRENALFVACGLEKLGDATPAQLRSLGTGPKTLSILYENVYNWFERVERGIYRLSLEGRRGLEAFPEMAEYYREKVLEAMEKTNLERNKTKKATSV